MNPIVRQSVDQQRRSQQQQRLAELMQTVRGREDDKVAMMLAAALRKFPDRSWQTCKGLVGHHAYIVYLQPVGKDASDRQIVATQAGTLGFPEATIDEYARQYKQAVFGRGLRDRPDLACVEVILREGVALSLNFMPLSAHLPELAASRMSG